MSNLIPKIISLNSGLDLSSPKMLVEPGSMIDCLNYELVDYHGYRRIDGFSRYDGNVTLSDLPNGIVREGEVLTTAGTTPFFSENELITNPNGEVIGYIFRQSRILPGTTSNIKYIMFEGTATIYGTVGTWSFKGDPGSHTETTITQDQLIALQAALRAAVQPPPGLAVGLHWFRDHLFAVIPQLMIFYEVSVNNEPVTYEIGTTLTTGYSAATGTIRDKVVTQEATASLPEQGYLIIEDLNTGAWSADADNTYTLGGGVSVGSGFIYHQIDSLEGASSTACTVWKAVRPGYFNEDKTPTTAGWAEQPLTYTAVVTLTAPLVSDLNAIRRGNTEADSTYAFDDGVDNYEVVLLDYFISEGSLAAGDAVIYLQFEYPGADITTAFDFYTGAGLATNSGGVTSRMTLNYLPGLPNILERNSRYQFVTSNFYATDGYDAFYGVNGAGRSFVFGGNAGPMLSFIFTQTDASKDKPRHIESYAEHLALGFESGSVQLSVVGQPTNFSGLEGASEFGAGAPVTGLYSLAGEALAIFCTDRIRSIAGTIVDNFSLRTIASKTGCIEYSLANCGEPVYLDNRGICTLSASDRYGDFNTGRLSTKVFTKIRTKLRNNIIGFNNVSGVACAIPVREKNQYRLFFNDGEIYTMTLRGNEASPGFTMQKYFFEQSTVDETQKMFVPIAWTSQIDDDGVERIFASHYNLDSPITTDYVFALDTGDSFDGNYIPHYFTVNWMFEDNPQSFSTLHAIRLHGLSRGLANLNVQASGAQNDFTFGGTSFTTTTTPINLPRTSTGILADNYPTTNRCDIAARGLAIQLKFSGSNTDISLIEPSHVAQVLITYSSPDGAFDL